MRVWIVNHYAALPTDGAGTRHFDLGRVLARRGHTVVVFASSYGHFGRSDALAGSKRLAGTQRVARVVFRWIRTPRYTGSGLPRIVNMLVFAGMFPVVQLLHRRPDVIVGSTVHPFAAMSALMVARARRVPFVYEVRDLWPETLVDMGAVRLGSISAQLFSLIQRRLCGGADHVIYLLPGAAEVLRPMVRPGTPLSWLPNGVDLSAPEVPVPEAIALATAKARADDTVLIGYVGSMGPANGLDTLVEAMHLVEERAPRTVRCLLVGDGPDRETLESTAVGSCPTAVVFLPRIDKGAVRPFLRSIDAAVVVVRDLPVYRFGISLNKLFDYLGAARPVVIASAAVNDPIAEASAGMSVPPGDPSALADAILGMARTTPAERAKMGRRGFEYVREHHEIQVLAAQFEAILLSVIQGRSRP